ncbi:MAG: hypothetical protein ABH816_01305 [Candidatus Levyibacteriota bacterium]
MTEDVKTPREPIIKIDLGPEDQTARNKITAEMNQGSALAFVNSLREKPLPAGPLPSGIVYSKEQEFADSSIIGLANRWNIPIMLVQDRNHFLLGLKEPELHSGKWQVLVYDPMRGCEQWHQLDYWSNDYSSIWNINNPSVSSVTVSQDCFNQLQNGTYNLSLAGDEEIANHPELYDAKQARIQGVTTPDSWNCGPLALFAAALRTGVKEGPNEFKSKGRDLLLQDTGIKVLTREEIFSETVEGQILKVSPFEVSTPPKIPTVHNAVISISGIEQRSSEPPGEPNTVDNFPPQAKTSLDRVL